MSELHFLILALAVWRTSSLLAQEMGPFDILETLRVRVGVRYDEQGQRVGTNALSGLIVCIWCSSVWFGTAAALLYALWPAVVWLALPLALSAGAVLVDSATIRGEA